MPVDDRRPAFPSTRWSRILAPAGARDLDALARAYWRPVQAWLAARTRCSAADADDLAQEAFAWLLSSGLLDKADPARGRFRAFLKTALANFANAQWRRTHAARRGGGSTVTALAGDGPADARERSPEQALDDAWRRELLVQAQARLQQELEGSGRALHWAVFRDRYLAAGDEPDHATLATRHGITGTDVANWLDRARRRYRALLREVVADTVTTPEELEDELRWLFGTGPGAGS